MSWMVTYTGREVHPLNLRPEDVDINDIAHALSNTCRFGGHSREFYSVAQHSVLVSALVPPEDALAGLLHDAAEAYMADLITPIKAAIPGYAELEGKILAVVCARFGVLHIPPSVKKADLTALATEKRDLMTVNNTPWPLLVGVRPSYRYISPSPPKDARHAFLARYNEIRCR